VEVALTAGSIKATATIAVPDGTEPEDMEQHFAGIEGDAVAGDVAQVVEADLVQSQSTALTGHVTVGAVELKSVQRPPELGETLKGDEAPSLFEEELRRDEAPSSPASQIEVTGARIRRHDQATDVSAQRSGGSTVRPSWLFGSRLLGLLSLVYVIALFGSVGQ